MKTSRKALMFSAVMSVALNTLAAEFDKALCDTTLRVDFTLGYNNMKPAIFYESATRYPGWAGRRHRLKELHAPGNMQVTMQSWATGDTLYTTSLNPLFMEWIALPDSWTKSTSMHVPVQLPMPREKVVITATLTDNRHNTVAKVSHPMVPTDILIRCPKPNKYKTFSIGNSGPVNKCIDLAIVPEGYTNKEMKKFREDCRKFADELFSHEPFKSHRDRFNITGVEIPSQESGVSVPRDAVWRDTAFGTHYDTFYSQRYLTVPDLTRVADALDGVMYDNVVILANTDTYGGGGFYNSHLLTAAHNEKWREVSVHEFGHSFAGLGDEYAYDDEMDNTYPDGIEPWEKNITTLVDFGSKWADMCDHELGTGPTSAKPEGEEAYTKVGVFEGAGYRTKGVYRPTYDCRMRSNKVPEFCPVCRRAITETITFFTTDRTDEL